MRVLVTGGSGFVGRYVVRRLVEAGHEPVCLVRSPEKLRRVIPQAVLERVRTVPGTLFDVGALSVAAQGCRGTIHLVGIIAEDRRAGQTFERIHVQGTEVVLRAAQEAGMRRFVHMSALGTRPDAPTAYHQTKWLAEQRVRNSGLEWTIFRPSLIHGPDGEFMRMVAYFCRHRWRQPALPYFGKGTARLQPVFVEDVAACFVQALTSPAAVGRTFELGGADRLTWRELYDVCAEAVVGRRRMQCSIPMPLAKLMARFVMPLLPRCLAPYKFTADQVIMSQEDNVCNPAEAEAILGVRLRGFRETLPSYVGRL